MQCGPTHRLFVFVIGAADTLSFGPKAAPHAALRLHRRCALRLHRRCALVRGVVVSEFRVRLAGVGGRLRRGEGFVARPPEPDRP